MCQKCIDGARKGLALATHTLDQIGHEVRGLTVKLQARSVRGDPVDWDGLSSLITALAQGVRFDGSTVDPETLLYLATYARLGQMHATVDLAKFILERGGDLHHEVAG